MSKEVDVSKAASWDEDEARLNIQYLKDRSREDLVETVLELRGGADPTPDPAPATDVPEPTPESTPENLDSMTVAEALEWAGDDEVRGGLVLQAEMERDVPRKGILEAFEAE